MIWGWIALAALVAVGGGRLLLASRAARREALEAAQAARSEAARARDAALSECRSDLARRRGAWEAECRTLKASCAEREERLVRLLDGLEERGQSLAAREAGLDGVSKDLDARAAALAAQAEGIRALAAEQRGALVSRSGLGDAEASGLYLRRLEATVRHECESRWDRILRETEEESEHLARSVLQTVLHRIRTRQALDPQRNVVRPKPETAERWLVRSPELKAALEALTGVEIAPEPEGEIRFSAYDGVAREVAKMAVLESDRRADLDAGTLQALVREQEAILLRSLTRIARRLVEGMGIRDMHPDILRAMGRLRFRTSYGQNILEHSCEAGHIAAHLAAEVGLDPRLAMRCGLLHDLGKALTTAEGGMHDDLGAELARRCGEHASVVDAIEGHHHDNASLYTRLAMAADAISGARPGARRETYEKYVERIEQLTAIASSFPEVQSVATMKAGREVRVQTRPQGLSDEDVLALAGRIAERISSDVVFPGEIQVLAIKETKVVEHAR